MTRFRNELKWSDVTAKADWLNRRSFMAAGIGALALPSIARAASSPYSTKETPNKLVEITNYNNFYEFGWNKEDPAANAHSLTTDPWSITIDGLVDRPGSYGLEDILKHTTVEERIYRLRCVEGWSMVIPWDGFELSSLLERVGVQSGAKYVRFETLYRPEEMPAQKTNALTWPYVEGLRLDEAMNPLTILATGLYGEPLPNQNGAPVRLVVPWKYGFKSIKSVTRITLQEEQPISTWQALQPAEYGFYANVNPEVDHPRWSQATERRIGAAIFAPREATLMFNGYGRYVADLYKGQDLAKDY